MENWKQIAGYEGLYSVSDQGNVRSHITDAALSPYVRGKYLSVTLHRAGARKCCQVHLLVLAAFVSDRPDGLVAAHLDGDKANCALANLAWVTPAENEAHKRLHGTSNIGRRSSQSKFTGVQVAIIREANTLGLGVDKIAALTGASANTIHRIVRGERYTWA